jgi:hypothetical protein
VLRNGLIFDALIVGYGQERKLRNDPYEPVGTVHDWQSADLISEQDLDRFLDRRIGPNGDHVCRHDGASGEHRNVLLLRILSR